MGQENSLPQVDENTPPQTLDERSVDCVGRMLKEGRFRRVVVMTGAGISTSAGIPDFRSPTTGLYANLSRLNLPYAEAVFDIAYFRQNPLPFYTLAQELYPGHYRPTVTHSFIRLLETKGLLLKLFTQNIDCLEREAGVSDDLIVEAHGSFARQACIECFAPYSAEKMKIAITEKKVPYCEEEGCEGLVKPKIVFFGEQLPAAFFAARDLPGEADLCLVMGTSLSVQPFASLPASCAAATPRVLINMDQVGGIGSRPDDVLVLGDCDSGVRKLAEAAGWEEELEQLWKMTSPEKAGWREEEARRERERVEAMTEDERIEEEVEQLTRGVAETLRLERAQTEWLERHIEEKAEKVEKVGGAAAAASAVSETNGVEAGDISKEQEAILRAEDVPPPKSRQPTSADAGGGLQHVFPWLSRPSL